MRQSNKTNYREVALPWSDGSLSARLWQVGSRTVVGVPELGLHCYGVSESEAVFRLFNSLLKYYRQLKTFKKRLPQKGLNHLELLTGWVNHIEEKMRAPSTDSRVVQLSSRR